MTLIVFSLGLLVLVLGAEALVRSAVALAARAGLSPLVIGLTIVSFGTSTPELAVSLLAALDGRSDLAVGNVVGSNIFNIAVILGLSALVVPLRVQLALLRRDVPILVATTLLLLAMLAGGSRITRPEAGLLLAGVIAFTAFSVRAGRSELSAAELGVPPRPRPYPLLILGILCGLGMLVGGAELMVRSAVSMARAWGLDEATIGLTIVAAGTSLPELATSVLAACRRQQDIAIGNVVGSNIFNVLCILGASGLVQPMDASGIGWLDKGYLLGISLALVPLMKSGGRVDRWEGGLLVLSYGVYLWFLLPG